MLTFCRRYIHAVETILPPDFCFVLRFGKVERLRTSAALAAASLGLEDSPGACGFFPGVLPPFGELILGGGADRAPSVCGGAFAGDALNVRPSPEKLPLSFPQQLPMPPSVPGDGRSNA